MHRRLFSAFLAVLLSFVPLAAGHRNVLQQSGAATTADNQAESFNTGTTAVTVDVVVQDRRHKPITDLTRADFELYEDGVRQEIGAMQVVAATAREAGAKPRPRPAGAATASPDEWTRGVTAPTFLALVFDELTTEGRFYANKAAQAYLGTQHENDFAGVFQAGSSLTTVSPYTNDARALAAALRKVAGRATTPLLDPSKATGPGEAAAPSGGAPAMRQDNGVVPAAASAEALALRSQEIWEMERLERGYATADALRAIVGALGTLPGRKSVVFFADTMSMPEEVMPAFAEVTAAANRANVAIYTVDVAGLRAVSKEAESSNAVNTVGQAALSMDALGGSQNSLRGMEAMEQTLRENPRVSLSLLSRDTGGFLINDTNDLAEGFRRIDADRRFHYVLTYTPRNTDFGGEWRTISVKVPSRSAAVVRARSGYAAVRSPGAIPLLTYEGRAMADLDRRPTPSDLPIRATALVFPRPSGDPNVLIMAQTVASAVMFEEAGTQYRADFTMLARIRDAHGNVVRKASRPYRLSGPMTDKARVQAGSVLLLRQPTLPAGQYTLDVAVDDALAKKAGVIQLPVTVPVESHGPRVSSLVLVTRAEKVAAAASAGSDDNELTVGDVQLFPHLGQPYRVGDNLMFYAAIIPSGASEITATLGLATGETTLAHQPLPLPAVDASGRIRVMGQVPIAALGPGAFTLTLTIAGGTMPVVRRAEFSVMR